MVEEKGREERRGGGGRKEEKKKGTRRKGKGKTELGNLPENILEMLKKVNILKKKDKDVLKLNVSLFLL